MDIRLYQNLVSYGWINNSPKHKHCIVKVFNRFVSVISGVGKRFLLCVEMVILKRDLHIEKSSIKIDKIDSSEVSSGNGVMGVDIGEIHPIVCNDGPTTSIFNGRYIRSIYRLRNKVIASLNKKIDRCKKHSKQWWHLVRRKWKRIRTLDNQIRDGLHKHTTRFVQMCVDKDIGTIVIGDLTNIRESINYGKRANQKLHQWAFGKVVNMITYKAKTKGIDVQLIDESYTSQTCPQCLNRKKPTNREYTCKCGFEYHRDGVGAINIRKKYLDCFSSPVAVSMATPVGIRLDVPTLPELDSGISLKERKEPQRL